LKKNPETADSSSSSSTEQNVILNLLTTPKYRAMSAMYIIFRLMDNISLLSIIVLSIIHGALTTPTAANLALFSAIGLEVFYDVMLQTNKYWILERLSIYIGLVLYFIYGGIVWWKNFQGDYSLDDLRVVLAVLGIRFIAFILEECVDIAIDGELHNDLLDLEKQKNEQNLASQQVNENTKPSKIDEVDISEKNKKREYIELEDVESQQNHNTFQTIRSYLNVCHPVKIPENVKYKGSLFAWSPYSVFTDPNKVWNNKKFPRWLVWCLCGVPFIMAIMFFFFLIVICIVASLIPIVLTYLILVFCCCKFNTKKKIERKNVGIRLL